MSHRARGPSACPRRTGALHSAIAVAASSVGELIDFALEQPTLIPVRTVTLRGPLLGMSTRTLASLGRYGMRT